MLQMMERESNDTFGRTGRHHSASPGVIKAPRPIGSSSCSSRAPHLLLPSDYLSIGTVQACAPYVSTMDQSGFTQKVGSSSVMNVL